MLTNPHRKNVFGAIRFTLRLVRGEDTNAKNNKQNVVRIGILKIKKDTVHTYTVNLNNPF